MCYMYIFIWFNDLFKVVIKCWDKLEFAIPKTAICVVGTNSIHPLRAMPIGNKWYFNMPLIWMEWCIMHIFYVCVFLAKFSSSFIVVPSQKLPFFLFLFFTQHLKAHQIVSAGWVFGNVAASGNGRQAASAAKSRSRPQQSIHNHTPSSWRMLAPIHTSKLIIN